MHGEADDVLDLLGEGGIVGAFEGSQAMGCDLVGLPDAPDCGPRQARSVGHGATGPVSDLAGRFGAGELHDLGDDGHGEGCLAGLAAALAKEPFDATLGIVALPSPDRRPAHFREPRDFEQRQLISAAEDDPRPLDVLQRPNTITDARRQARKVLGRGNRRYSLGHDLKIAWHGRPVNPMIGSVY